MPENDYFLWTDSGYNFGVLTSVESPDPNTAISELTEMTIEKLEEYGGGEASIFVAGDFTKPIHTFKIPNSK